MCSKLLDIYCTGDRKLFWGFLSPLLLTSGGCYETADVLQTASLHYEERCASISVGPAPENRSKPKPTQRGCEDTAVVLILKTKTGHMENIYKTDQRAGQAEHGQNLQPNLEPLSNQLRNIEGPDQESLRTTTPTPRSPLRESDCWCGEAECTRKEQHIQAIGDKLDELLDRIWRTQ